MKVSAPGNGSSVWLTGQSTAGWYWAMSCGWWWKQVATHSLSIFFLTHMLRPWYRQFMHTQFGSNWDLVTLRLKMNSDYGDIWNSIEMVCANVLYFYPGDPFGNRQQTTVLNIAVFWWIEQFLHLILHSSVMNKLYQPLS